MKNFLISLLGVFSFVCSMAQTIEQFPIVGGVTNKQAKIYIRTSAPTAVEIQYSKFANFSTYSSLNTTTTSANYNAYTFPLNALSNNTVYYYRFLLNGNYFFQGRSFKTFPAPNKAGYYKILSGSCVNFPESVPIFDLMATENANLFLMTGDWGYPDTTETMPGNNLFFSRIFNIVLNSYKAKYTSPQLMNLLNNMPMDYNYDDHDYMNDNCSKSSSSYYSGLIVQEVNAPAACRANSIKGYNKFFPHYTLSNPNVNGIYHSFKLGNAEFFVLDCRSNRSPNTEGLSYSLFGGTFNPPASHTMLGTTQLNWLTNGLNNSTATWKFIISSVCFNKAQEQVLDYVLNIPLLGVNAAAAIIDSWAGFKTDQQTLLNSISANNIKNVFVVSGDSHTSAIDDGANGGLPEMMAANLLQTNSQLANIYSGFGFNIWNQGGQGLGNSNYNNTYGKIEIFNNDSMKFSIVDEFGTLITKYTAHNQNLSPRTEEQLQIPAYNIYTSGEQLYVKSYNGLDESNGTIHIYNTAGELVEEFSFNGNYNTYNLSAISSGIYIVQIATADGISTHKIWKK